MLFLEVVLGERILYRGSYATELVGDLANLNNVTSPGFYKTINTSQTSALTNAPSGLGLMLDMFVIGGNSSTYFWQIILNKNNVFYRSHNGSSDSFSEWQKVATESVQ